MDRLEAMALLIEAVDAGSFSAAARRRGMAAATLTRRIDQLEARLGAVLLLRSTRRLTLTDAGRDYVAGARAILTQADEIERAAAGEFVEPTGRLVVSAPRMFGRLHVLPIVHGFLDRHAGITIDLRLADGNVDLAAGAADVAVRIGPLPDSSLIATRVGTMGIVTVASPALVQRYRDLPTERLPMIALDMPLPANSSDLVDGTPPRLTVTSAEAAADAAIAGIGAVRLLHYQAAGALSAGHLTLLHTDGTTPVHLLHAPTSRLTQKARRFLDDAQGALKATLMSLAERV